jgi:hypothetical protein
VVLVAAQPDRANTPIAAATALQALRLTCLVRSQPTLLGDPGPFEGAVRSPYPHPNERSGVLSPCATATAQTRRP